MRTRLSAALLVAVAGCAAAAPVRQPPADVVQIRADRAERCKLVGPVEGSHANGGSVAENEWFAVEDARGRAAKEGANAIVVRNRASSMWRTVVKADAYLCPSWEPVPGLAPQ